MDMHWLELTGVPINYCLWVVVLALPVIALVVCTYVALENGFINPVRNRNRQ